MNYSDFIINYLVSQGIEDCFCITGGGICYLTEALRKNDKIGKYFYHHEQSAGFAAEGYFRASNKPCLVLVTTGPGSTNVATSILSAWQDSIPVFYIGGQNRLATLNYDLRCSGDQTSPDMVHMYKHITKMAVELSRKDNIKNILDDLYGAMTEGRPGPVWLSVPLDIQKAEYE